MIDTDLHWVLIRHVLIISGACCNDAFNNDVPNEESPAYLNAYTASQIAPTTRGDNGNNEAVAVGVRYHSDNHSLRSILIPQATTDREKSPVTSNKVILIAIVTVLISVVLSVAIMIVLLSTTNIGKQIWATKDVGNSEEFAGNPYTCTSEFQCNTCNISTNYHPIS